MVVLNFLLQYNNEVNSNQTPTNSPKQTKNVNRKITLPMCAVSQIMLEGLTFNNQEILK